MHWKQTRWRGMIKTTLPSSYGFFGLAPKLEGHIYLNPAPINIIRRWNFLYVNCTIFLVVFTSRSMHTVKYSTTQESKALSLGIACDSSHTISIVEIYINIQIWTIRFCFGNRVAILTMLFSEPLFHSVVAPLRSCEASAFATSIIVVTSGGWDPDRDRQYLPKKVKVTLILLCRSPTISCEP